MDKLRLALLVDCNDSCLLGQLLAVIHQDGGQFQHVHGTTKAVWAAMTKWYEPDDPELADMYREVDEFNRKELADGIRQYTEGSE